MERRTILYIVFIFFVLGASIELLKDLSRHKRFIRTGVENNTRKIEDYDVKLGTESAPEIAPLKINGFDSGPSPIKGVPVANKSKDKKKIAAKKDDKKAEEKKKKKKKNKTVSPDGEVDKLANNKDKSAKDLPPANLAGMSTGGFANLLNNANNQTNNNPKAPANKGLSLAEWEKILLGTPANTDIQNFINAHHNRAVSDADFFTISRMMIEDTRANIRLLSLTILDSYLSIASFDLLAEVEFNEPANSDFRSKLDQHLLVYSKLENFAFLAGGLNRENSTGVNTVALNTLQKAIVFYQPQLSGAAFPNSTTTTNRLTLYKQLVAGFTRFQTPLRTLATEKDPNISSKASQLLAEIISISTASTNPTPTVAFAN